jgi:hypothetical protein
MTPVEHLREYACDRHAWPVTRELAFTYGRHLRDLDLTAMLRSIYDELSGGVALPAEAIWLDGTTYNWGQDTALVTERGDGLLFATHCFGALPGDGIDHVHHLLVGEQIRMICEIGWDYTQRELAIDVSATAEAIDVATDALLEHAATAGLQLVRRVDDIPPRTPRRH